MRWLEAAMVENLWVVLLMWAILYVADYVQTLRGAQLYHAVGKRYLVLEGSYELTPFFQPDIDGQRKISYRFLLLLIVSLVLLSLIRGLAVFVGLPELFSFAAGGLILRALVAHLQHFRNIRSFRYMRDHPAEIKGQLVYVRRMIYWNSAGEFGAFAGLYLILFAFTGSWFVAGGVFGCAAIVAQLLTWRRKTTPTLAQPEAALPAD